MKSIASLRSLDLLLIICLCIQTAATIESKAGKNHKSAKSTSTPSTSPGPGPTNLLQCSTSPREYTLPTTGPFTSIPTPPGPHLAGLISGFESWLVGLKKYETPIAIRLENFIDMMDWNCVASYSEKWKDALTRGEVLVRSPRFVELVEVGAGSTVVDLYTSDARLMCMASAWATVVQDWVPEASSAVFDYLKLFEYPASIQSNAGFVDEVVACFDQDGDADSACLRALAESHCYTPYIMGRIIGQQIAEFGKRDGWNMYGDLGSDGSAARFNKCRYTDPTGYKPSYDASDAQLQRKWSPLLEENGGGYFSRQEHVVPHIGSMAKPRLLTRDEINNRTVPTPMYNYTHEALLVASRMANLTDEKKMLIEFYDDKVAVVFALTQAIAAKGVPFEYIVNVLVGMTASSYDSTILAWKEKVNHDLVRPTTWIQDQMSEVDMDVWVKGEGVQTIKGKEFMSWVRVMPHAEHVSGSGCIFQALYEHIDDWLANNLNINDSMPVTLTFPAGTSKTEPDMTPSTELTVTVSNLLELRNQGGQSRLDGGMHFTQAIEAAHELCEGVGHAAGEYTFDLWNKSV